MRKDKLSTQAMDFAVSIIALVKSLKEKKETTISNQIGRSGTSIGANICEAQYAHGKADFIVRLQIALKEANETGYWLVELLYGTEYVSEADFKRLSTACTGLRAMLVSSINTAKGNGEKASPCETVPEAAVYIQTACLPVPCRPSPNCQPNVRFFKFFQNSPCISDRTIL